MTTSEPVPRVPWWHAEPSRLARDKEDVCRLAPELSFEADGDGDGFWRGVLARWPFHRDEPIGLDELIGPSGLEAVIAYPSAYPMIPPFVLPLNPVPLFEEWTLRKWHVLGDGSLCLFQTFAGWDPAASINEILLKAAGWRIEYALVKAGALHVMSERGIATDSSLDALIAQAAAGTEAE